MNLRIVVVFISAVSAAVAGVMLYDTVAFPQTDPPVIPEDIAAANNAFAVDFYKRVASGNDGNIFFSPASMHVAFSALYEGAGRDTAVQMENVFGFDPDQATRHNSTGTLASYLNQDVRYIDLKTANSLWVADRFELYNSYLDTARSTYLTSVEKIDLEDDGVTKMNRWASHNTGDSINRVITQDDVDTDPTMVIHDIASFEGTWVTRFPIPIYAIHSMPFRTNSTHAVAAEFMHVSSIFVNGAMYIPDKYDPDRVYLSVLKMPYQGDRLSMLLLHPNMGGMEVLEDELSAEMIHKLQQIKYLNEVRVIIPKFEMRADYNLIDPLKDLGMTDIFDGKADLLGMLSMQDENGSVDNLHVSQAFHNAHIKVDGDGIDPPQHMDYGWTDEGPKGFWVDSPFVFIIQDDESGAILFMGRVSDPTA